MAKKEDYQAPFMSSREDLDRMVTESANHNGLPMWARMQIADYVRVKLEQNSDSDPFIGRRAYWQIINGSATPQDFLKQAKIESINEVLRHVNNQNAV